MLLPRTAIVAGEILVDDEIAACIKEICLMGVHAKFGLEKHCLVKHFAFLKNVYQYCIVYELLMIG